MESRPLFRAKYRIKRIAAIPYLRAPNVMGGTTSNAIFSMGKERPHVNTANRIPINESLDKGRFFGLCLLECTISI